MITPDQIKKLPRWAQKYIIQLEGELESSKGIIEDIKAANPASRVFYPVPLKEDVPIGTDCIKFQMPSKSQLAKRFIDVRFSMHWQNRLEIRGVPDCLGVYPHSGNSISVSLIDL